jgi:hypothetical protein
MDAVSRSHASLARGDVWTLPLLAVIALAQAGPRASSGTTSTHDRALSSPTSTRIEHWPRTVGNGTVASSPKRRLGGGGRRVRGPAVRARLGDERRRRSLIFPTARTSVAPALAFFRRVETMRRSIVAMLCVVVWLAVALALGSPASAADTNPMVRGKVVKIDKETSTITLEQKDNQTKEVVYTKTTTFKMGSSTKNEPSSIEKVEVGHYMGCAGAMTGKHLVASTCTFRAEEHK